jgi:hypothetical protein
MTHKKSVRAGHRGAVRRLITQIEEELQNLTENGLLEGFCETLKRKRDLLFQLDTEILYVTPEETEIDDADQYTIDIESTLAKVRNFSKKRKFPAITSSFASQTVTQHESHPVERSPSLATHTPNTSQVK